MGVPLLDAVSLIALQTILNTQVVNLTLHERREVKKPVKIGLILWSISHLEFEML